MICGAAGTVRRRTPSSQSEYFQRDHQAASTSSASSGHRQVTFRQDDNQVSHIPRSDPPTQATRPATPVQKHFVESTPDFNALIEPELFEKMERASSRCESRYDGRQHSRYAISVKKYTSGRKQPLNQYQLNQLIPLLQTYNPAPKWSWQSLITAFRSFTSAGVFKLQKHTDQVKENQAALQAALLEAFLNAVSGRVQSVQELSAGRI